MKIVLKISMVFILFLTVYACNKKATAPEAKEEERKRIEMITDHGTMLIELYNETPLHRDNFIKHTNDSAYDSLLFHRVIATFMIQGGDPDSKNAQPGDTLGNGGLDYTVAAEFNPNLFHKRGVLAAARDNNPERESSSMQFYIVQGGVQNDSLLDRAEKSINKGRGVHYFKKDPDPTKKALLDSLQKAIDNENWPQYTLYRDSISSMVKTDTNFQAYTIPEEHRQVYKTIGGTPHLDQNYTVYGEVVEGIEVIDSIAPVATDSLDRPLVDVRIMSVKVVD